MTRPPATVIRSRLFLLLLLSCFCIASADAADKAKETAYERVMQTKTIRCGYLPYEPYVSKDPVTGKLGGLIYDYLNAVAAREGFGIDWADEVNIDQVPPALDYGRIDAFCIPCTPDENWAKRMAFSSGLGATPYYIYVREDSALTEEQLKTAKFLTVDGYALTDITRNAFPDAVYYGLPQTTSMAEMYEQLRYKKVDAIINDPISAAEYMKNNPGVIRRFSATPVIAMRMFLPSPYGDAAMTGFLLDKFDTDRPDNLALMQGLLEKYAVSDGAILLGAGFANKTETDQGWKLCESAPQVK